MQVHNIIYVVDDDMKNFQRAKRGFTLIEVMLVLVIVSVGISMLLGYVTQRMDQARRDRETLQIQQILNAAMVYYVNNGKWPDSYAGPPSGNPTAIGTTLNSTHPLLVNNYLPPGPSASAGWVSPYGTSYITYVNQTTNVFYVFNKLPASQTGNLSASLIASTLPSGFTTKDTFTNAQPWTLVSPCPAVVPPGTPNTCDIVAAVNVPGQNLGNARSVNFGDIYHSGGCVPVPVCPGNMVAEILAVPASVSGAYDTPGSATNVYPISSFTAYATAPSANFNTNPANCTGPVAAANDNCIGRTNFGQGYWRVCLSVTTERGVITTNNSESSTQALGSILAVTRCVPPSEPSGSDFLVW